MWDIAHLKKHRKKKGKGGRDAEGTARGMKAEIMHIH